MRLIMVDGLTMALFVDFQGRERYFLMLGRERL